MLTHYIQNTYYLFILLQTRWNQEVKVFTSGLNRFANLYIKDDKVLDSLKDQHNVQNKDDSSENIYKILLLKLGEVY